MDWFNSHFLSTVVFFPLAWGLVGLLIPGGEKSKGFIQLFALAGALLGLALVLMLVGRFDGASGDFQLIEQSRWIPLFGATYYVGVDGISIWLMALTGFLAPLVVLSSFHYIETRPKEYYFFLMLLQTGMLGAFVALDVFLFYVFWEVMLVPMYFLIGVWGGKERVYAAMKFFLYTMVGSLLMLVAIFYLAFQHKAQFGAFSMSLLDFYKLQLGSGHGFWTPQSLLFLAFALAFAIKVPLFPLHTWLPDAHVQAPTGGSVILAGVLLKLGGYGFLRFAFPLFPEAVAYYQPMFLALGTVAIVYGAWVAMIQPDMKKLVAYSSVSHMGYVMIGLFSLNAIGVSGALFQMLNHGVSTGALFLLVGMIYERRHTREIADFGGLTKVMPLFAVAFMIITLSSVALPGTNGFVGEFLILLGAWKANHWVAGVSGLGVIFGAAYMLWMFQRVMFGPVTHRENKALHDLSLREVVVLLPLIVASVWMGVQPNVFLKPSAAAIQKVLERTAGPQTAVAQAGPVQKVGN